MKTPMQELIEQLEEKVKEAEYYSDESRFGLYGALDIAKSMLEKEKEVMESAWQDGMYECDGDGTFEDFYKTFKTREK